MYIINLKRTREKLLLAAQATVAIENLADVSITSSRNSGQLAIFTLGYVDTAIPCNNKGAHSVGLMWWMVAREVLHKCGTISHEHPWEVLSDLDFYRNPEEMEKEKQAAADKAVTKEGFQGKGTAPVPKFIAAQPKAPDWSEGVHMPSVPIQQFHTEE
ncbi:40s ribosomal protein sa-like [Lynx pardinus]|uniref:40s ribosomal protein sa-like n=1 Tax=Lynx pardinus TaxID=191816 RepID=A0A485MXT8_LYNPA|nr:40s ribosomal protein sa-like [Lynx pardinus]